MRQFKREKVSSLAGPTEVRFTEESEAVDNGGSPFRIVASKAGVRFEGNSTLIEDMSELQAFAELVSQAYQAHHELRPKLEIVKNLQ